MFVKHVRETVLSFRLAIQTKRKKKCEDAKEKKKKKKKKNGIMFDQHKFKDKVNFFSISFMYNKYETIFKTYVKL